MQVTELNLGHSATDGSLWKLGYEYAELKADNTTVVNTGNITKQTISFNGLAVPFTQTFKYDSLNRLKEAKETTNTTENWFQQFNYDRYGNRLRSGSQDKMGNVVMPQDSLTFPTIEQSTNRFDTSQGYGYDKNGNIISDVDPNTLQSRSFTFNGENKQTVVKDANNNPIGTYYYDGEGKRVKKVTNTETTIFVYSGGKLIAEYSTVTPPTNPTTSYTATDQLGSPRVITNSLGEVIARRDFQPFGDELYAGIGGRTGDTGQKYSSTKDKIRQKFTGYQRDDETGLDFAEARYYNNAHGRFTAVDPLLASGKSANPQTFNRYVYTMNRPLILTDPSGLQAGKHLDLGEVGRVDVDGSPRIFSERWRGTKNGLEPGLIYDNDPKLTGLRNQERFKIGSQAAVGAGGEAYNIFAGTVNATNFVVNRMNFGYFATGTPSNEFGYLPTYEPSTQVEADAAQFTGNSIMAASILFGGAGSAFRPAPSFGFTTQQATGAVTVFRVEGTANQMLSIGENGTVSVTGNRMLFLNFGDAARAESFAARRVAQNMEGVEIKSFQVNRTFFNEIRNSAVPESMRSLFPTSPIRVDTRFSNQFGIPSCRFSSLCGNIIPGSGTSVSGH